MPRKKSYSRATAYEEIQKVRKAMTRLMNREATRVNQKGKDFLRELSFNYAQLDKKVMSTQAVTGLIKRLEHVKYQQYFEHYDIESNSFQPGYLTGGKQVQDRHLDHLQSPAEKTSVYRREAQIAKDRQMSEWETKHRAALQELQVTHYAADEGYRTGSYVDVWGEIIPENVMRRQVARIEKDIREVEKGYRKNFEDSPGDSYYFGDGVEERVSRNFTEIESLRYELIEYFTRGHEVGIVKTLKERVLETLLNLSPKELKTLATIFERRGIKHIEDYYEGFQAINSALLEFATVTGYDDFDEYMSYNANWEDY